MVGAPDRDDGAFNAGAVYVFVASGSTWVQQAKLTASDGAAVDLLGTSVAISGDTLVAGAFGDDDKGDGSGSAYVFVRNGDVWTRQAKLTAADGAIGDGFGLSVGISGDRVIAGAATNGPGAFGAAYLFQRNGNSWPQMAKLIANDGTNGHFFGWSVDIDGDRAVVGAPGDGHAGQNAGSVYEFEPVGGRWVQRCKLTAFDAAANKSFGWAVAIEGTTVVAGSIGDDVNGSRSGAAFDFVLGTTQCLQSQHRLVGSDTRQEGSLGTSVAVSGSAIVAGATGAGAAYIFPAG